MPTFLHKVQELLAVRIRGQLRARWWGRLLPPWQQREKAFPPEEPAVRHLRQPARAQGVRKPIADRRLDAARRIDLAGVLVARDGRDACEDGRLADAILANENCHGAIELELEASLKDRQAERKRGAVLDSRFIEHDALEERR